MLYLGFMAMMSCAMLFGLLSRMEPDETKKQMHLRSCFAVTWMGLCYLGMATGNGAPVCVSVHVSACLRPPRPPALPPSLSPLPPSLRSLSRTLTLGTLIPPTPVSQES